MKKILDKHVPPQIFWPAFLLLIFCGLAGAILSIMVVGSNPFQVTNLGTVNVAGQVQTHFHPGDVVVVRRQVCTDKGVTLTFYPGMRSAQGVLFALPVGASRFAKGCRETLYGFTLPPQILPGTYTYQNLVQYQTNWIGRDEANVYPPLTFEVVSNDR